jgi:hypothetical protein
VIGWRARAFASLLPGLLAGQAFAAKTDIVVLANGDRITGEVQELERGRLTFKTDDIGTLEIEWDNVRSVTATASFDVDDLDGNRYVGSLEAGAADAELRIVSPEGVATVPFRNVARIRRLGSTFWSRLDGSIDVGASYTSASELFNLDVAASLETERPGWEIVIDATSTINSQPEVEDTRRSTLSIAYARRFQNRWLALVQGQLEQNRELGFDLRSSAAAGGGRYFVQSQRDRLLAGLALSVNRERPVDGEETTNVEAMVLLRYDRYSYDYPKVDVSVTAAGFTSLSDGGRHRVELDARLKRELVKDFYATLRGYESYDSRPATEGAPTDDYGVTFALGWSF